LVDSEHKEIFRLAKNVLGDAFADSRESVVNSMEFLTDYTVRHFGHEEDLMEESSYPETEQHRSQHRYFARKIAKLNEKLENDTTDDTSDMSLEIKETIVNWLVEHVLGNDKRFADYYKIWSNNQST